MCEDNRTKQQGDCGIVGADGLLIDGSGCRFAEITQMLEFAKIHASSQPCSISSKFKKLLDFVQVLNKVASSKFLGIST